MSVKFARVRASRWSLACMATAALALFAPLDAASACDLLVETPDAVRIEYNPFAVGSSSGPLNIEFANRADEACELRLVLIDDLDNPVEEIALGGVLLEFRPREASGLFRHDADPGAFLLRVAENDSVRAEMDVAVLRDAVVEAGEHSTDLRMAVQNSNGEDLFQPVPLRVILRSTPRAQVNIAGGAGAFGTGSTVEVIDFGTASTGLTRRAFLQVRANTEATLTVVSQNRGVMHLVDVELEGEGTTVPYTFELDGAAVDMEDPWIHKVDPPRTLEGVSLPMDFTLGVISGQMSGRYEDVITIDVTPR